MREVSAHTLDKLRWQPEDESISGWYWVAKRDWAKCVELGQSSIEPLIMALEAKDTQVRQGAVQTLGQLHDPQALQPLVSLLKDKDAALRQAAAKALGRLGDRRAVGPLMISLNDRNEWVRSAAAQSLGQLGDPQAVKPLVGALKDWYSDVRRVAMLALGQLGNAQAVKPLIGLLKDRDNEVRRTTAEVLGQFNDERAVNPLIATLSDQDGLVRETVAQALGQLDDIRAIEPLIATLEDDYEGVRQAATHSLKALLKLQTLGAFVWGAHMGELSPAIWQAVSDILNQFGGAKITGAMNDKANQLASLIHHIADQRIKRRAGEDALIVYVETLRYYHAKIDTLPREAASTRMVEAANFCFKLSYTATQTFVRLDQEVMARQVIQRTIHLTRSLGNAAIAWQGLNRLGQLLVEHQRHRLALEIYDQFVSVIERTWFMQPIEEEGLRHFFADKAEIFDGLALCRLRFGAYAQAWETLEEAKTRYLGDLIARRQRPPQRRYQRVSEDFWAAVQRAQAIAQGRDPNAPAGTQELVGIEANASASDMPVAIPRHKQILDDYLDDYPSEWEGPTLAGLIVQLWRLAARLPGHPLAPSVREALGVIHQVVTGLVDLHYGNLDTISIATLRDQLEAGHERLIGLNRFDQEGSNLELWWFAELWGSLNWEFLFDNDAPYPQQIILELEALLEVLDLITGRGRVYVTVRPRGPDDVDEPSPIFRTRAAGGASTASQRFDQAEATLVEAWERLSRTNWRYVFRLARGDIVNFVQMRAALAPQPRTALVEFHVTEGGTIVYLSRGDGVVNGSHRQTLLPPQPNHTSLEVLTLPHFTLARMREMMADGWVVPYQVSRANPSSEQTQADWLTAMEQTLGEIYEELLYPVDQQLQTWEVERVIFVPHRALHLLPLHACWRQVNGQRRYLLDDYEISYTPSCTLAQICRERAATRKQRKTLTAIADPTGDLPFSMYEVARVANYFSSRRVRVLQGNKAHPEAVTAHTPGSIVHFSCHGYYNWGDPLESHLLLAGNNPLTLGDLFSEDIPLPETLLTTLSACETNITDPEDLADEYLGIASGFLFAGTPAVISTLWAVNDLASALLIERFYQHHLQEGLTPATSLRLAQCWLRDVAADELRDRFAAERKKSNTERLMTYDQIRSAWRHFASLDPGTHPFTHPFYWAAFTASGV